MNPELFTDEFRSFKYLKSSEADVKYYRNQETLINTIPPADNPDHTPFVWQKRIEFLEQLIDLVGKDIWFVDMNGTLRKTGMHEYDYDMAKLIEIKECVLYTGFPRGPGRYITPDDINDISSYKGNHTAFISSKTYYLNVGIEKELRSDPFDPMVCLGLCGLPIFPGTFSTYNALFYDKAWAELYQKSVTQFHRKNNDAISAISRLF